MLANKAGGKTLQRRRERDWNTLWKKAFGQEKSEEWLSWHHPTQAGQISGVFWTACHLVSFLIRSNLNTKEGQLIQAKSTCWEKVISQLTNAIYLVAIETVLLSKLAETIWWHWQYMLACFGDIKSFAGLSSESFVWLCWVKSNNCWGNRDNYCMCRLEHLFLCKHHNKI